VAIWENWYLPPNSRALHPASLAPVAKGGEFSRPVAVPVISEEKKR